MAVSSNATINAHNFELSYRAHPSVTEDPFYTVPQNATDVAPGTLLKVERLTNTSFYTLAPNLSLSRFMYQSKTSNGTLVPVSAYVLWPYIARDYEDGLPVVVWAHGTSGVNVECAPSNIQNLWHHFQAPYQLALLGYVVVATDYAGLGVGVDASGKFIVHEYLNGLAQANDVAYSIPAANKAFPELSKRFVVIGSSQGGLAAWGFAEKLVSEPMDGHLGTIALSPVTRVLNLPATEAVIPQLLLMMAPSLIANFPGFKPEQIFTPEGQQSLETYVALRGCNTVLFNVQSTNILKDGWQNNTSVQEYQKIAGVGGKRISGAMLVIQGGVDPIVYPQSVTDGINETLKADPSAKIEYHLLPNVAHAPAMYAGLQIYLDWIAARFSRQPVKPGFSRLDPQPIRPAAAQQLNANWFIQTSVPIQLVRQRTVAVSCFFILFISLIVGLLVYYLPLYFQIVQGSRARDSGIRNLPFLVTILFAPIVSGALISTFGYYVPFIWLGAALATIGSGLLSTLRVESSSGSLSAFQFLTGLGLGICTQIPFNAIQYILPKEQVAMGSALVSFCNSLGPILGTNIGQTIFSNLSIKKLEQVPGVDAAAVISAGPTNLAAAETSSMVREAFNYALTREFVLAIVSGGLAFACSMAMEWGNVKRERKHVREDTTVES